MVGKHDADRECQSEAMYREETGSYLTVLAFVTITVHGCEQTEN